MFACDELTASLWRVDRVTSRPGDELTCEEFTLWRVNRVTSWPCDELTVTQLLRERRPELPSVYTNENSPDQ